ncbi:ABC transporter permease [Bacillus sp. SG-1]|uniref:ABC transporter permease n=1 Tax=Bacillus sp. SG-1 TaxID=161544 RepID=UPI0001543DE0|nr:hypothetical protein [Bacillus sp. SG-1]EDL66391.1 peptide ABC transporter, permease protein [Bacillus sp. SG-1]
MGKRKYKWLVILCAGFVIFMLAGSLVFNFGFNGEIPQTVLTYDKSGKLTGGAPFEPSAEFPFGTDREGYDMFFKVLQGAQYTLGAAIVISVLSFVIAFLVGIAGGFINTTSKYITQTVFTSFYFIPQSIIAYNVLYPLLWEPPQGFETTFAERVLWQSITLAVITVPTTAILIANETREILQKEFILSARVLGGSPFFLFRKHLLPHLKVRLFIIFPKIIIQVLLIIAHLGFFKLFYGGTDVCYGPFCDPPKPFVQEWASLMAMNYRSIFNDWWIFMVPMFFFSLTILSLNGITKGLEGLSAEENKWEPAIDEVDKSDNAETVNRKSNEEDFHLSS